MTDSNETEAFHELQKDAELFSVATQSAVCLASGNTAGTVCSVKGELSAEECKEGMASKGLRQADSSGDYQPE